VREHRDTDFVLPFASGTLTVEDLRGDDIEHGVHGGVEFRMSVEDTKGLVAVSEAFETMQDAVWEVPVAIGWQIAGLTDGAGRIRGNSTYRFPSGPFFEKLDDVTLNGDQFNFEASWTDVIVWDRGRGITFRTEDLETGYSLAVGLTREDLERHLEAVAASVPAL
jgi:hypothetical protein